MFEFPITLFSFSRPWYRGTDVIPGNTAARIHQHRVEIEEASERFYVDEAKELNKARFTMPESVHESIVAAISSEQLIKHGPARNILRNAESQVEKELRATSPCSFRNPYENRFGFLVFINAAMTPVQDAAWALRAWFGSQPVVELIDLRESIGSEQDRIRSGIRGLVRAYRTGADSPDECAAVEQILPALRAVRGFGGKKSAVYLRSIVNELRQEVLRASAFSQNNRVLDESFIAEYGFYFFRDRLLQIVNVKRCRQTAA